MISYSAQLLRVSCAILVVISAMMALPIANETAGGALTFGELSSNATAESTAAAAATTEATTEATAAEAVGQIDVGPVKRSASDYVSRTDAIASNDLAHASSNLQANEISLAVPSPHLALPATPAQNYQLESEGIPSRVISVYDNSQNAVGKFLQPRPIVDTIQEHEKYGNSGDKFYPIGRAIVNTYEGFSNLLNKILDAPIEIAKQVSRSLTGKLNAVGGKIVGL